MQLNGSDEGKGIVNSKALGDERLESSTSDEIRHNPNELYQVCILDEMRFIALGSFADHYLTI